jgi:hypothetical protein
MKLIALPLLVFTCSILNNLNADSLKSKLMPSFFEEPNSLSSHLKMSFIIEK